MMADNFLLYILYYNVGTQLYNCFTFYKH